VRYVTPQQVIDFVAGVSSVGNSLLPASIMLVIDGVESAIDRELGGSLISQEYADEVYRIDQSEFSKLYGDIVTVPRYMLKLKNSPVTTLTSIKQVTSWNASTGAIETTSTVPRNSFQLVNSRFVVFNAPFGMPISQPFSQLGSLVPLLSQFDAMGITLLITYEGGYIQSGSNSAALSDLRLAILIEIQRYFKMQKAEAFDTNSIDSEFGRKSVTRHYLTPETVGLLRGIKGKVIG